MLVILALVACKKDDPVDSNGWPEVCNDGQVWDAGETAYVDASADWGLTDIAPLGVRISAVDFDGDGWTDLAVRKGMQVDTDESRQTWLLRNTGDGTFEDVTASSGIRPDRDGTAQAGATWVWADVDGDGDLDVYQGVDGTDVSGATSAIVLNDGDGTFSLGATGDIAFAGDRPYGAAFTDVDLDGDVDLWVTEYPAAQDYLYLNDGSGNFTLAEEAGLKTTAWSSLSDINNARSHTAAWAAVACDLNNDGYPELLSSSYGRAPNHLWQNNGDGTFTNVSVASGYAFDDRKDWTDNESARCWCKLHPTDDECDGVPDPRIACSSDEDAFRWNHSSDRYDYRLGGNSGGTTCADIDNDGYFDLVTSEIVHWDVGSSSDPSEILFNLGTSDVAFERPGPEATGVTREHSGTTWDDGDITGSVWDFDNDGWPDVYIGSSDYSGTRALLFHSVDGRTFESVPIDVGIDHTRAHGSAVADFDRDGDLDVVVGHSTARCGDDCYEVAHVRLFENQLGASSNWMQLELVQSGSNTRAVGARVEVTSDGVTQTQDVDGGHGQWGQQDDLVLHFGLGAGCDAEVTVTWADAAQTQETFTLGGGYRYRVEQGQGASVVE